MNTTIQNERIKLIASFLNGLGMSSTTVGVFIPIAKILFESGGPLNSILLFAWVAAGVSLHIWAQLILEDLE
ncbi:MAG: hypothetical protein SFV19_11755 [Rhodospirillaceae bacterium]|nr:hypothetical protein [Rhodospirillaceae bacterium]